MKKLGLFSLAVLMSGAAMAEGYQVNMLSAKQTGMGHVGVAMKLGAESMHFNPAGMAFMEGSMDFSAGVSAIWADATYKKGDYKAETDNDVSTPMYAYAGFRIYDNLKAGISVTTPYGSGLKWPHNWRGAELVQDISLKSFVFQPTIAWKVTDNFSIGGGLMIACGNFELSRALVAPGALAPILGADYADVVPVSARLSGKSQVRVGFNVGAMWDINEKVTVGASYRSKVTMKVKEGEAELNFASDAVKALIDKMGLPIPPLNEGTFKSELPLPANLTVGVSYRPIKKLELAFDLQMVGWDAYQNLNVKFTENVLGGYSIDAVKNYKNSFAARIGAEYAVTDRFDVRLGTYFDQSPVRDDFYNPETPGMNKIGTSLGFSFRPYKGFSIDFAATYIAGLSRDGSYTTVKPGTDDKIVFSGRYGTKAFAPTVGLSYNF